MKLIQLQPFINLQSLTQIEILSAKISDAMRNNQDLILRTDEGFSFKDNGLFDVLDRLCEFWQYDGKRITIETNNWIENHTVYNIKESLFSSDFTSLNLPINETVYNKEKIYGMFLGRCSQERLYGIIKHRQFKYSNKGLTSFNELPENLPYRQIEHLLKYKNVSIDEILNLNTYSDVDSYGKAPIFPPYNTAEHIWSKVYEQINIEIVFETNMLNSAFQITEKTLRPIAYKRPFIAIAPQGYLNRLRSMGFKTFENVIPNEYDNFFGLDRVDFAFQLLDKLISSGDIDRLLNACQNDVEHNYQKLLDLITQHKNRKATHPGYYNKMVTY